MRIRHRTRKYFAHASSQLKYIKWSIFAALIASLLCSYFWIRSEELVLREVQEGPLARIYAIRQTIRSVEKQVYNADTERKIGRLKNEVESLKSVMETKYFDTFRQLDRKTRMILIGLFCVFLSTGLFVFWHSHRRGESVLRKRPADCGCAEEGSLINQEKHGRRLEICP